MNEYLKIEAFEDYCIITLNRPEKRNALNKAMRIQLIDFFEKEAEKFPVIILTATGKGFCAGLDLKENPTADDVQQFWKFLNLIYKSSSICIAAVNGAARGGGVMLINACDIAVSSEAANFGMPEVILKSSFDTLEEADQTALMDRAISWLPLRGKSIAPIEAKEFGILNQVVPPDLLIEKTKSLIRKLDLIVLQKKKENLNKAPFDNSLRQKEALLLIS